MIQISLNSISSKCFFLNSYTFIDIQIICLLMFQVLYIYIYYSKYFTTDLKQFVVPTTKKNRKNVNIRI